MLQSLTSEAARPGSTTVIDCAAYCGGVRVADVGIGQIRRRSPRKRSVRLARTLRAGDRTSCAQVQQQFGLHDLAIEDAYNAHQRPKLELYEDSRVRGAANGAPGPRRRAIWSSARRTSSSARTISSPSATARCARTSASGSAASPRRICSRKGPGYVLYALMDFVVDQYLPIVAADRGGSRGARGDDLRRARPAATRRRASISSNAICWRCGERSRRSSRSAIA